MLSACSSSNTQHRDGLNAVKSDVRRKTRQPGFSLAFTPITSPTVLFMEMLRTRGPAWPGTLSPGHLKMPVLFATYGPTSHAVSRRVFGLSGQGTPIKFHL